MPRAETKPVTWWSIAVAVLVVLLGAVVVLFLGGPAA